MSGNHIYQHPPLQLYYDLLYNPEMNLPPQNSPPSKLKSSLSVRFSVKTTHNNKCVADHYLLACQYILLSLKTLPSGLDMPNKRGRYNSLTSLKTQRGWSSKVKACLCTSTSSGGTCLVWLCPWALISMTLKAVKYLPSTPVPPLSSLTSCLFSVAALKPKYVWSN